MSKKEVLKAKYNGEVDLSGFKIVCAVLDNGQRIFSERSIASAFGIRGGGAFYRRKKRGEIGSAVLPEYLSAKYLEQFISNELRENFESAVSYIDKSGKTAKGIDVSVLPNICDVYITAKNNGVTNESFLAVAEKAYLMIKSFAKVGIIALVDEATGYQYERERDELQTILNAYISKELLEWQKRFPDSFYKEIFRLNGWDYTVSSIKKRPGVVGKWTTKLIYEQLPKGVLNELKRITPKTTTGIYKARFHQSLTKDIGHPDLQSQIYKILGIMNVSDNWQNFIRNFNKMVDRKNGVQGLKFEDLEPTPEVAEKRDNKGFDLLLSAALSVPAPSKTKK